MADASSLTPLLRERFGLTSFRKGQAEIIASILAGRDTMAIMPTGSGKSLCYQLPALAQTGLVIVVSPLISLMNDQVQSLRRLGIPAGCIHSGQEDAQKREVFAEIGSGGPFILFLSPERVQKAGFIRWVRPRPVTLFAIDEAHCISQWGHDFRPDYAALDLLRAERPDVPMMLLTATATPHVISDISSRVRLRDPEIHVHGFYRPNLYIQVAECAHEVEKMAVLQQALRDKPPGRAIIYCGTRKGCEEVAGALSQDFNDVDFYHAGLPPGERERVQGDYNRGTISTLVATNAFGMGIDHPDVRLVAHYQVPANLESYYQEMGRAGRDGKDATCLLLYARKDKGLQSFFIRESVAPPEIIKHRWTALDTMIHYAEGGGCRHGGILTYFRDSNPIASCGHCDTCDPKSLRAVRKDAPAIQAARAQGRPRRARGPRGEPPKPSLLADPLALRRMETLRDWRKTFAKDNEMPAFLVFSDKTLRALADRNPASRSDLLAVYGIGEQKADFFGSDVLKVLRELEKE